METNTTTAPETITAPEESTGIAPGSILETGEIAPPSLPVVPEEKPEWLPEKYWREGKADFESMAKSHAGLEQLLGKKSKSVLVPNDKSTPEELAEYRKAMGVPDKPEDYLERIRPEIMPEGVQFDDNLAKAAAAIAQKHNIPPAALRELAALQMTQVQALNQTVTAAAMQELESGKVELAKVYGDQLPAKLEIAKRAAATVGVNPASRGFTDPDVVKAFITLAEKLSDDQLISAESAGSGSAGMARAVAIMTNTDDPYHERYTNGDPEAVDLVRRFMRQG